MMFVVVLIVGIFGFSLWFVVFVIEIDSLEWKMDLLIVKKRCNDKWFVGWWEKVYYNENISILVSVFYMLLGGIFIF